MTNANNDRLTRVQTIPCRSRTVVEKGIRDHSCCEVIWESFSEWLVFNTGWSSSVKTLLKSFVVSLVWYLTPFSGVLKEYKRWIFVWRGEVQACRASVWAVKYFLSQHDKRNTLCVGMVGQCHFWGWKTLEGYSSFPGPNSQSLINNAQRLKMHSAITLLGASRIYKWVIQWT